ncbi:hypothetical protein FB460_0629 [Propioniferax innocua]|uniref:Uncharacterized protein n=2 Tax=Propioniferax innocua TaxID=1753 RepID=A0A542ZR58_9ACTN|nr:hypothetical protein FB460_0629 [Propioniferax innocua]
MNRMDRARREQALTEQDRQDAPPTTGASAYMPRAHRSLRRWWIALALLIAVCVGGLALEFWLLRPPNLEPLPLPTVTEVPG